MPSPVTVVAGTAVCVSAPAELRRFDDDRRPPHAANFHGAKSGGAPYPELLLPPVGAPVIPRPVCFPSEEAAVTAILGISAFYHDSAAALVVDGEVVAAAQEERFTREKHDERFPANAVAYCLEEAGLSPAELDYVAFYDKPLTKFERLLETYLAFAPRGLRSFRMAMPVWLKDKLLPAPARSGSGPRRRNRGTAASSSTITKATPPAPSSPARSTRRPS